MKKMKNKVKAMIAFIAVIAVSFIGYNVYKVQSTELLSDIAMANVEALANTGEGGSSTTYCCGNYGDCMKVMLPNGTTTVIKGIRLNSPCIN
jgi:hypothetical protein